MNLPRTIIIALAALTLTACASDAEWARTARRPVAMSVLDRAIADAQAELDAERAK